MCTIKMHVLILINANWPHARPSVHLFISALQVLDQTRQNTARPKDTATATARVCQCKSPFLPSPKNKLMKCDPERQEQPCSPLLSPPENPCYFHQPLSLDSTTKRTTQFSPYRRPPARARLTVALPLAKPTPLPRKFLLLNMGALRNMSGTMKKRTCEPRIYTCSRWETRPSRAVTVMSLSWTFMLSSARNVHQLHALFERRVVSGGGLVYHRGACRGRFGRM